MKEKEIDILKKQMKNEKERNNLYMNLIKRQKIR